MVQLPDATGAVRVVQTGSNAYCTNWTGSVTVLSDVPSWSVSVDLTCSETGMAHLRWRGVVSGQQ